MKLIRRESTTPAARHDIEALFDHFLEDAWPRWEQHLPKAFRSGVLPVVNLSENEMEFTAAFELPGIDEKDIDVQVLGNRLTVSGERKWEQEKKEKDFYRVESQYGSFRRDIQLPEGLSTDPDAVSATFSKGMLEVRIPKVEPRNASKIKIKSTKG